MKIWSFWAFVQCAVLLLCVHVHFLSPSYLSESALPDVEVLVKGLCFLIFIVQFAFSSVTLMETILVYFPPPGSPPLPFCYLPLVHDLRETASHLIFLVLKNKSFLPLEGGTNHHWINHRSFSQASLSQSVCIGYTGWGGAGHSCSELLLSTAVVHTVLCKGVNIFIMFIKFILYTCRSRLLFGEISGVKF